MKPSQKDSRMENTEHIEGKSKVSLYDTEEVSCAGDLEEVAS